MPAALAISRAIQILISSGHSSNATKHIQKGLPFFAS
jgi:hypothetical protein